MLDTLRLLIGYFYGGGIGWWLFFFIIAVAVTIYIFYDSSKRKLENATFWRMAILVDLALFLPTILFRFTVRLTDVGIYYVQKGIIEALETYQELQSLTWRADIDAANAIITETLPPLTRYFEIISYIGLFAGVVAIGLAVGYWLTFRNASAAPVAPVYQDPNIYRPQPPVSQAPAPRPQRSAPAKPSKPRVNAWLVKSSDGKNHQLFQGATMVGRSASNDIAVIDDPTVSGQHIKITEENGHFTLVDLASTNGTWVNGHRVRQPVLLDTNDEIKLGDNTVFKFVAS